MNPAVIPFLSNTVSNESRLENALLAIDLFSIIPLYGVRTESGVLDANAPSRNARRQVSTPASKTGSRPEPAMRPWSGVGRPAGPT
jgi:hypothetical protein